MPDTFSDAPLDEAELVALRRHLGYGPRGSGAVSNMGWRFFDSTGTFEFRALNLAPVELQDVRRQVAILVRLEADLLASADNLDTAQAAVWTRNPAEVRERRGMLQDYRRDLAAFLGVPLGPLAKRGGGAVQIEV